MEYAIICGVVVGLFLAYVTLMILHAINGTLEEIREEIERLRRPQ
jgi:hypothetical protein